MSALFEFEDNDIWTNSFNVKSTVLCRSGSYVSSTKFTPLTFNIGKGVGRSDNIEDYFSLYSDARKNGNIITPYVHGEIEQTSISKKYPHSASINVVKVRANTEDTIGLLTTKADWYNDHWQPIEFLYNQYSKVYPDIYFTGSYDHYCYYNHLSVVAYTSSNLLNGIYGDAFTIQFNFKTAITGTNHVLFSQYNNFEIRINSGGYLEYDNIAAGQVQPITGSQFEYNAWNNYSLCYSVSTNYIYVYKNNNLVCRTETIDPIASSTASLIICGKEITPNVYNSASCSGFIHDVKIWSKGLLSADISSSYNRTLTGSDISSSYLQLYSRFNDGPFGQIHGYTQGSGTFNYSTVNQYHGQIIKDNTYAGPAMWFPNDNSSFYTSKVKVGKQHNNFLVIHIPNMIVGRGIVTGSVRIIDNLHDTLKFRREIVDDGRGALYVSSSYYADRFGLSESPVKWNKVGNVFYNHGIIIITDPSMQNLGSTENTRTSAVSGSSYKDLLQFNFDIENKIITKTLNCRARYGSCNSSHNETFSYLDGRGTDAADDDLRIIVNDNTTYITSVGLYDDDMNLVAVAKLAQPIRKREKDNINFKLKIDL